MNETTQAAKSQLASGQPQSAACDVEFAGQMRPAGTSAMKRMMSELGHIFSDEAGNFRKKVIGLYILLVAFNIAAWAWAIVTFAGNAVLLGSAVLAYSFGLRHAFDADHIASIDTVTRKLMQQKKCAVTVGLHFALGHSLALVVFVGGIAAFAAWGGADWETGFTNGTLAMTGKFISVSFLILMAAVNLAIAWSTYLTYRNVRKGGAVVEEDLDILLNKHGILSRIFRPLFRLVDKSWHMVIIGFLFGLGFDTATEASLLGITGVVAAKGLSLWSLMVFPALFAAGMTLMDTTDSVLMVRAYGWGLRNPVRKLYYNLTITIVSGTVALALAGIEVLAIISEQLSLTGPVWDMANFLSEQWEIIGILVVSIFVVSWLLSTLIYRMNRFDDIDSEVVIGGASHGRGGGGLSSVNQGKMP